MTDTTTRTIPLTPPLVTTIGEDRWLAVALLHQREPDEKLGGDTQRFTNAVYVLVGGTGRTLLVGSDGIDALRVLLPGEQPF